MKKILIQLRPLIDFIVLPLTIISTICLLMIRKLGLGSMPISNAIFNKIGLLPVHDHYYQPLINPKSHKLKSLKVERKIGGIDLNLDCQEKILSSFHYAEELLKFPILKHDDSNYYYNNSSFESGDSEYLYSIIRKFKPNKIIEIGSGYSTKMMLNSLKKNGEDPNYSCSLTCVEPFEYKMLEGLPINLIKEKVEMLDLDRFKELKENDILFIDSSHVIRPQGDVLFEFQRILPNLNPGVFIHFHDIFTPRDYLNEWIYKERLLWNEQYLLEAFLAFNNKFEIIGSLNYLKHNHWRLLSSKCPVLSQDPQREPGSFWIRKVV